MRHSLSHLSLQEGPLSHRECKTSIITTHPNDAAFHRKMGSLPSRRVLFVCVEIIYPRLSRRNVLFLTVTV